MQTDDGRRNAVVVVNHGSHELLERYLAPLAAELDALVVVVDNSAAPADRDAARDVATRAGWHLVPTENDGFGAGVNAGAAAAVALGCDVLLVLNPDLAIDAGTARDLLDGVRASPGTVLSPRIVRPDGTTWFAGGTVDLVRGRTSTRHTDRVDWLSGAGFAVATSAWTQVGGFDDAFFLYWEDVDLSVRLVRAGHRLVVRDDLTAVHDVGGTQAHAGTRRKSDLYYRHNCRSRLVFAARHLSRRDQLRWVLGAPGFAWEVLLRGGRRQLLRSPRPALAAARGTLDGTLFVLSHGRRPA
ncbi:glycosyltransferase family 2 protein [Cellulomonas xylanilytica]|uniref:Glycosyl transferase n=1 Tax=Cellulomonas xylanilytica TaxID=233583 RepID=A0A510V7T1_9CELL|nr:glycosyltransferase [Cellulomonas xylanilytica]GEK21320.1 hypothetical protein CXY01_18400 [Cellulomonas xylanilytica]